MFKLIRTSYLPLFRRVCDKSIIRNYTVLNHNVINKSLPIGNVTNFYNLQNCRHKSKKEKRKTTEQVSDDDEELEQVEDDWESNLTDKSTRVITTKVNSLRTDLVLKAGLNIARNKIETLFYESKIRVNGKKIFKKSEQLAEGDEVDLIRGLSPNNPQFLLVSRIEILLINDKNEGYSIKMRRCKSLVVENYADPWKPSTSDLA